MDSIITLLIGWILGIASAVMIERIGTAVKTKRTSDVVQTELEELRLQLVLHVFKIKSRLGTLSREDVDAMKVIADNYQGARRNDQFEKFCTSLNEMVDAKFDAIRNMGFMPGRGIGLKTLGTPAIDNSIEVVGGFPKPYRAAVLEIKQILGRFNQEVEVSMQLHQMTFDTSIVDENRQALIGNIETSWTTLTVQAEEAIALINKTDEYRASTLKSFLF